jgi:putative oxidoreductase
MRGVFGIDPGWGITPVRIVMGLIFVVAGYTKLTVAGLPAVTAGFAKYSIPLPGIAALLIAVLELVGGLLLLGGFGTRLLGTLFVCEFIVTTFWVKFRLMGWNDGRLDLMILAGALLLVLAGPGRAALDKERRFS